MLTARRSLTRQPELEGRVSLRFRIGRDGRVVTASSTTEVEADELVSCFTRAMYAIRFAAPRYGFVAVSYPWSLFAS